MKINVNENCLITLTKTGAEIINRFHGPIAEYAEGAVVDLPLWEIMRIFGPHMQPGAFNAFVGNDIDLLHSE